MSLQRKKYVIHCGQIITFTHYKVFLLKMCILMDLKKVILQVKCDTSAILSLILF